MPSLVKPGSPAVGGSHGKAPILRERLQLVSQEYKSRVGRSAGEISSKCTNVDDFFDTIAIERLRRMPQDGDRLDSILRQASRFAFAVNTFYEAVASIIFSANDAAALIWGSSLALLDMGIDQPETLESILGRYGRVTQGIALLMQGKAYFKAPGISNEVTEIYADLLQLVCTVTMEFNDGCRTQDTETMNQNVNEAFFVYFSRFNAHWRQITNGILTKLHNTQSHYYTTLDIAAIYEFLDLQDRPLQMVIHGHNHSLADGSFAWFDPHLTAFALGEQDVMAVTGHPGSGKSALSQWTIERLQISAEYDVWNVINYAIRPDVPITELSLSILKGLLQQMLDQSIQYPKAQKLMLETITKAVVLASAATPDNQVVEVLWNAMEAALTSDIQFMIVLAGLEQMRNSNASVKQFLGRFQEIICNPRTASKLIVFSRVIPRDVQFTNAQLIDMDVSNTGNDLKAAVDDMMALEGQFYGVDDDDMESIAKTVATRAQGNFVWAQLALHFVAQQKTTNEMYTAANAAPEALSDLIQHHLDSMNLDHPDTRVILALLAVSERPLQVREINQLLTIDSKGPHLVSRVAGSESETFRPVSPLVVAQDGYVTFRHPTIRQHIRELADSMKGDYSNNGPFPFNLQEANYELLMRSVAWVKFCVEEDVEISFDKLRADDRDALFDTYPLLEYTSRYWYTHLLESPMTTEEGAINFVTPFKRALPDSTLFAQLELTCFESQFSRSSILELYRLSVDVRGTVLGEDANSHLQSLIFSGRAAHKADTGAVNEHLYKAWILSRTKLGASSPIASSLAELVATTVRTSDWDNAPRGDTTERRREEALRSLIATDSEGSPLGFPSRFGYLAILVKMFKDNGDEAGAYNAAKKFYHNSTRQYGSYSTESSKSADFLTHHFDIPSNDEMALTLARSKYENMLRTLPVTDDRRIAYTLYMARLYEQQNQNDQAEAVLANLWGGLSAKDVGATPHWDKKTKVAFAYYQFLRRHGRPEEAEVIMRDLTADFETDGVQSPEMLEQAETLRNEARTMELTDLESMLSMLIWRYYKKAGLEHSPQAVALAETLVADSATNNAESLAVLSTQERVFLHELIDSIASSESRLSMSVLILCHNLATVHISDEEWQHGSDCVMAVLRHAWPTVEDAESDSKFPSDRAPHMANLAMDLAYCSFQRLNVPKATVVYGNAFKAAIIADKVSVPVVDSVVKTVVGFYEETFQYSVALVLLRQVSQFYLSRLGVSDKHTIDSLYHKGDLAARLERTQDAENAYATIYKASLRNGKIGSVGVRAAVALLALFEANKKWDSALEVYRHLWPTLVRFDETDGYDRALLEGLLDKTYTGYMSILSSRGTTEGYSEKYRVSSEHLRLCKKLYGHSHNKTLQATLSHAGVCEDNDKNIDESISLYQQVLRVNEWVPSSQASRSLPEMSHTLPISTKHKLAKLHLRKQSRDHEAGALYKEEMALARKRYGHSSTSTLRWLREVAMFYASQNTMESWSKGSETLGAHVDETIRTTEHQETLIDRAHKLAEIYIECGYIDSGNKLIDELHQQIVYERPASQKSVDSYQPAVFVASFEEHFRGRQSYSQIMDELNKEGSVFGSFEDSLSSRDLVPTLASGERLHRVQADQKRTSAAKETQSKLYTYFCNTLSISHLQRRDVIRQFYNICRREVMFDDYNANIIVATSYEVKSLCDSLRFQDAADLAGAFHSFIHLTDGLRSYESVFGSLKLCLYLNGYDTSRCSDEKTANNMAIESKLLLQEIMSNAKEINVQFSELPFNELNNLVTVLGEHELFEDLEIILTDLWTSRVVQRTWSLNVVVWIGRRLVETRYCRGDVKSAIKLGSDICYNLRQVWGNCDSFTLEMTKLLSGMYTASGDYRSAVILHETALNELLVDQDAANDSRASEAVSQHLELLRHAQARRQKGSKSEGRESPAYMDLISQLSEKFDINTSSASKQVNAADDNIGVWHRPRRFSLDVEEELKHYNHLRHSSGATMVSGHGGGSKRISVSAL